MAALPYEVRNLVKRYAPDQPPANDGTSLEIYQGEVFGLLGPNGAGKTTLIQQLTGLSRPTSGTIRLFGYDVVADPSALPGMVCSLLLGTWQMGIPLQNTLAAVPPALLAAASLTLVGAGVGSLARTQARVNLYSNVLYLVVIFLSPVMAPVEKMPALMRATSYLFPIGQAAMAITDALQGSYGPHFWGPVGLLCAWLLAAGFSVAKRLDWRAD